MSVLQTVLTFVVAPLGLILLIGAATLSGRGRRRRPYRSGQPWPYQPVLWTADPIGADLPPLDTTPADPRVGALTESGSKPAGLPVAVDEHAPPAPLERSAPLARGAVITGSGRVSVATELDPDGRDSPFTPVQLSRLDEALTMASRETGLRFNVYLGDLGSDPAGAAQQTIARLGAAAEDSVLVAVSPEQKLVEVVTGPQAAQRLPNRGTKLGVMTMVASFKRSYLLDGLLDGLRMLSDQTARRS